MAGEEQNLFSLIQGHMTAQEDRTRERIILASKKRFLEEGFARVTIGDLCHRLHCSKRTFYKHFSSKEDLVTAIVASNFKMFLPKVLDMEQADVTPDKRVLLFMDFALNVIAKNISVPFMADVQALMPELWEMIDAFRKERVATVAREVIKGQKSGLFRKDIQADVLVSFLMLIVSRVLDPKTLYEHDLRFDDIVRLIFDLMLKGIYNPEPDRGNTQ